MMQFKRSGLLVILSSPSGAGKSTLARRLMAWDPTLRFSVSATTRKPRPGEVEGEHYFFRDAGQFRDMVARGEMLEHAEVFGNFYGTPRAPVEAAMAEGRDTLFDVDWQGGQQIRASVLGPHVISIFILPPSLEELERRNRQLEAEIDERKRIEERLRRREALHRQAQDLARLAHWEYDIQADALTWSEGMRGLLGLSRELLDVLDSPGASTAEIRRLYLEITHPDDRARVQEAPRIGGQRRGDPLVGALLREAAGRRRDDDGVAEAEDVAHRRGESHGGEVGGVELDAHDAVLACRLQQAPDGLARDEQPRGDLRLRQAVLVVQPGGADHEVDVDGRNRHAREHMPNCPADAHNGRASA